MLEFKSSCRDDHISNRIIPIAVILAQYLKDLINLSSSQGKFPMSLSKAKVIQLHIGISTTDENKCR